MRAMAKRLGIDLADNGTALTRGQVLQAARDHDSEQASERVIPMRGIRRAVAEKVTRSRRDVPEAAAWVEADVTELWHAMRDMTEAAGERIRFLPVLCRAAVSALGTFPVMNSRLSSDGSQIELLPYVHLGMATSTDRGLTVPVVRDAQQHSILGLSDALAALTERARAGTLAPAELSGGTFTVNNYGVLGVDAADPIINVPEVAILGVGRAIPRPWVVDGQVAVRRTVQLAIAADHRVVDGREAGGFLRRVADLLERPALLWSSL
jgi:pyruvate dehydrogenase E2 component (dihydrolipoamide acetyltransferase)